MRRLLLLLLILPLCTACTALPAEERAFAVVLGVAREEGEWAVSARIPTYQTGGGYATITGKGATLDAAMADMDAAAPMHLHLGQLRLLVLDAKLGDSADLMLALETLSAHAEMRQQAAVAVTEEEMSALMDAMKPGSGSRLSKSIDVLLDTRIEQGTAPDATLADVIRMGERQTPVLAALTLTDGSPDLLGGWPMTHEGRLGHPLDPQEMQLLSLMQGRVRSIRLTLEEGSAQVREVSAKAVLDGENVSIRLTLRAVHSTLTEDGLEAAIAGGCLTLLTRLSAESCDPLGLGRQAIRTAHTMAEWHGLDWPAQSRSLLWRVQVGVQSGT